MSKLKIEHGNVDRDLTTKATYAMLMSLVFGSVVFLKVGNKVISAVLWKTYSESQLSDVQECRQEAYGIVMVDSRWKHEPKQWGRPQIW